MLSFVVLLNETDQLFLRIVPIMESDLTSVVKTIQFDSAFIHQDHVFLLNRMTVLTFRAFP